MDSYWFFMGLVEDLGEAGSMQPSGWFGGALAVAAGVASSPELPDFRRGPGSALMRILRW